MPVFSGFIRKPIQQLSTVESPSNYHIQLEGVSDEPFQPIRVGLLMVAIGLESRFTHGGSQ